MTAIRGNRKVDTVKEDWSRIRAEARTAREMKKTIIVVTHNQNIAKMADVIVRVKNGRIQSCEEQANPLSVEEVDW